MFSAAFFPVLLLAGAGATHPCADSSLHGTDGDFWADAAWEEASHDECDTEESLLFSGSPGESPPARRSNRASFAVARSSAGAVQSTVRQQSESGGWNHRVEIRNDTLTRRRLGWDGRGWRWRAGDLDDPEFPIWPAGLPRRTLPRGWRRAAKPLDPGYGLSAPRPQGLAAGVFQPRWKAWAARAWNPVETGDEPPWSPAWNLRHASTGISTALPISTGLPWELSAQWTETRITREVSDSVAEQSWSAGLASPRENFRVVGALSITRERDKAGWALATFWRHRFDNSATVDFTARQRDDAWASSWDPAVTEANGGPEDSSEPGWGAGEFRTAGHFPIAVEAARTAVDAEAWRAWNPAGGTAREGIRGRVDARVEGASVRFTGTRRSARAASGSVSLYRYVEAETRLEANPGFRLAAFRAWNGSVSTRTGLFFGIEPAWEGLRASSGLRVEADAEDRLSARGSLGAQWAFARGWNLDAAAAAPCYPRWNTEEMRWRMTINYAARSRGSD
jgi:hypothetical protein